MAEKAKPKSIHIAIDTYALTPGQTEPLRSEMEVRYNTGWALAYMLNVDKIAYSCIYVIWQKES